ncbi:MAG TPA: flagellar export chaperone FliS [Glaciihabitans sp.]|jgi:flagellar protein FliS|nr:flagellar export chaperone FliS [Glaciihabitans sp.]
MSLVTSQLSQYNRTAILSAGPAQLLTMLYDRLLLDLERAEFAQRDSDWEAASHQLLHAQAIIAELQSSLKVDDWDGGPGLYALYTYVSSAMIRSNVHRNVYLTTECIALLEPLRVAWTEAAAQASTFAATAASTGTGGWGVG